MRSRAGERGFLVKPSAFDYYQSERQPWRLALSYASKLGTAALTYEIISRLIRIPFLNRILTLTTLTHYWKRAHEPETDLKGIR